MSQDLQARIDEARFWVAELLRSHQLWHDKASV